MTPQSYDQWVHCITVKCGISLTSDYAARRLKELRDERDVRTKKFREYTVKSIGGEPSAGLNAA